MNFSYAIKTYRVFVFLIDFTPRNKKSIELPGQSRAIFNQQKSFVAYFTVLLENILCLNLMIKKLSFRLFETSFEILIL